MKYAIMSDVHANPFALKTALEDARRLGCGRFVMLGDITGYGYGVERTLELVRENFDVILMGNHDSACAGLEPLMDVVSNRNYMVDLMHREKLVEEDLEWIRGLPYVVEDGDVVFTHGDFSRPDAWNYIFSERDAAVNFNSRSERILFCGHTHHATIWEMTSDGTVQEKLKKYLSSPALKEEKRSFVLKAGSRYIINVGSVGYPRSDRCSTYVVYDTEKNRITVRRLPVDLAAYAAILQGNGIDLPFWLYDALIRDERFEN